MVLGESLILILLLLLVVGLFAGIMAGLLGVGGGIVIVPALYLLLSALGVEPAIIMHLAVGTSLATIILTSVRSVLKHRQRGAVDEDILRQWAPGLFLGAVFGIYIAGIASTQVLTGIFAFFALVVAVHMAVGKEGLAIANALPKMSLAMYSRLLLVPFQPQWGPCRHQDRYLLYCQSGSNQSVPQPAGHRPRRQNPEYAGQ